MIIIIINTIIKKIACISLKNWSSTSSSNAALDNSQSTDAETVEDKVADEDEELSIICCIV